MKFNWKILLFTLIGTALELLPSLIEVNPSTSQPSAGHPLPNSNPAVKARERATVIRDYRDFVKKSD